MLEAAQHWAALGDVNVVSIVLAAGPALVGGVAGLLVVLSSLPETMDPRAYAHLLPRLDGRPPQVLRVD
jgi:hypothetical protein